MGTKITICAFKDSQENSIAYEKFTDINKAIEFYRKMLEKEDVNTISTRKVKLPGFKDIIGLYKE